MRRDFIVRTIVFVGAVALTFVFAADGFAQGRPGGGGGGGMGRPPGGGAGGGVDRPTGGETRTGWPGTSDRGGWDTRPSQGRSDRDSRGDYGRTMRTDRVDSMNPGTQRFEGLSRHLGTSANELQSQYQAARADNPNLSYGQWVAANMIAIHSPKDITTQQILDGLKDGKSIGDTLSTAGWDADRIKKERKRLKKQVGGDDDASGYEDNKKDWQ